jgi:hypothetical protein
MKPYTFYLFESGRDAPDFEFASCAGAEDAEALARRFLERRRGLERVEIYDGMSWRRNIARAAAAGRPRLDEQVGQLA